LGRSYLLPIAEAPDKTPECFKVVLHQLYRKHEGAEARDIQSEYFQTLCKPINSSPLDHSICMLTLACYGNKLPGNEPALTPDDQVKKCIFQSFPAKWQQLFIRSGQQVANTPLSDIMEFMSNEKSFADSQEMT
jgi:hypothetical protein